jgi:serine phosphatase RsbU (regulator of sigma subunit)
VQFVTLSKRFSTAYNEIEDLSVNLELKVRQRTAELEEANTEIQLRNQTLQAANLKIEKQAHELLEKNQDITDSIEYARRIQLSILPRVEVLNTIFPDNFVYYRPKDIVSGDFYWFYETPIYFYFAVADCTGHGVPGAFMSVLGTNLLTELAVQEADIDPALLLTRLNFRVREALNQNVNREGSQDGMEVALCRYHKGDKTLSFAGANRPLWLYRQGQLIEQPGDKQPIGGTPLPGQTTTFTLHTLQLQMGDTLFAFTDGVQDQFGGEQGRKFSSRRLRELIEQVAPLPALDRRIGIQQALEGWQAGAQQTDDILLISVRVP